MGRVVTGVRANQAATELRRRARDKWAIAERSRDPRVARNLRREAEALEAQARAAESASRFVL